VALAGAEQELVVGQDLVMFMPDRPRLSLRREVHAACLAAGVKLTCAEFLSASMLALGPTVVPGHTACWTCYDRRQQGTQDLFPEQSAIREFLYNHPDVDPVGSKLPALAQTLAGLAAFETVRILTNVYPPATCGSVLTLNCVDFILEHHPVLKLPRCPDCSPVRDQPPQRVWSW